MNESAAYLSSILMFLSSAKVNWSDVTIRLVCCSSPWPGRGRETCAAHSRLCSGGYSLHVYVFSFRNKKYTGGYSVHVYVFSFRNKKYTGGYSVHVYVFSFRNKKYTGGYSLHVYVFNFRNRNTVVGTQFMCTCSVLEIHWWVLTSCVLVQF